EKDLYCVLPAISCYLQELRQALPEATIYCLLNNELKPEIVACMKATEKEHWYGARFEPVLGELIAAVNS
ncbi:MAG: hypothetical protein IJP01_02525, partial [Oscillospiraceae bacterium]|nr:hypothetical protein [Oscillospiraceae bacterium]